MTASPSPTGNKTRVPGGALSVMVLGGCATCTKDGGFGAVEQIARERIDTDVKWQRDDHQRENARATVTNLLASPLSPDAAVQIALLNNPGLQATYAGLGIAEADLVQAGRMTNPHFAYLRTSESGERKLEWAAALRGAEENLSPLCRILERVYLAETIAHLDRATQAAVAERERLTRLLGLSGDDVAFQLPQRLTGLPPAKPR